MNCKILLEIWVSEKFIVFRNWKKEKCMSCDQKGACQGGCRLGVYVESMLRHVNINW